MFGELYLDGINSLRTGPPDRSECVLSMGRIAGQHLCPEQENFQIKLAYVTYGMSHTPLRISAEIHSIVQSRNLKAPTAHFIDTSFVGIFSFRKHFVVQHVDCIVYKHLYTYTKQISNNLG